MMPIGMCVGGGVCERFGMCVRWVVGCVRCVM